MTDKSDDTKPTKPTVATESDGNGGEVPRRAFLTREEAEAQASAIGKAHVEPSGVAFAVVDDE